MYRSSLLVSMYQVLQSRISATVCTSLVHTAEAPLAASQGAPSRRWMCNPRGGPSRDGDSSSKKRVHPAAATTASARFAVQSRCQLTNRCAIQIIMHATSRRSCISRVTKSKVFTRDFAVEAAVLRMWKHASDCMGQPHAG
jgi:hypothetical protein